MTEDSTSSHKPWLVNGAATPTRPSTMDSLPSGDELAMLRGAWGSKLQFILTCVGYAVGLGNVWRFPYLTYQNGGGAFIVPYTIMLILVGVPVFFIELCFGQFASLGPISIWKVSPLFKGIGCAMVATNWIIGLYYTVIIAWAFHFLFASFTTVLPWTDCDNDWNTEACITGPEMKLIVDNDTAQNLTLTARNLSHLSELKTPSQEYFYRQVLQMSESMENTGVVVPSLALCLFFTWFIVFLVLMKGIKSLAKVIYFVSLFPYVMLTVLVVRGATLPGAAKGVEFYLKPDPQKLANPNVWSDAATMVFYSLSTCTGGLIAMSSYNDFYNNCFSDSIIVPVVTGLTSLYSGFTIFTVLGFMAEEKGVKVSDVAAQGPGLVFVVYPEALSRMPLPPLWSVLFFFMLLTLGFSSLFSVVESVFVAIIDEFSDVLRYNKIRPIIFRGICILFYFLLTLTFVNQNGFYLFSLTDHFVSGFPLLFIGLTELFVIVFVYGYHNLSNDIVMMLGKPPSIYFKICWVVLTPFIILVCIIAKIIQHKPYSLDDKVLSDWGQALGWLQVAFILGWIPLIALIVVCREAKVPSVIWRMSQASSTWGPANPDNRLGTRYDQPGKAEATPCNTYDNNGFTDIRF